jgi:predicted metallopeptidase
MEMKYAKLWLKKFIKYNHKKFDGKTFNRKLNWAIVNLSHRVFKSRGLRGHNIRQNIRKELWVYSRMELKHYQPSMINRIVSYLKQIIGWE